MAKYKTLFSPIKIGHMDLRNRIVMAPMATNFSTSTGRLTERQIAYYAERAKGGVGLIISESNYVALEGRGAVNRLGLVADESVKEHRKLTETVHRYGAKICAQLHHAGATAPSAAIGEYPVSCSSTILPTKGKPFIGVIPRTLSIPEIRELVEAFGRAARRAREAGYDAVQVHGAHGYLINQFLSPHCNKRKDVYGGSPTNRMRFLLEVVGKVKEQTGYDFPVLVRLSGQEYIDGGYDIGFIKEVVLELEKNGADEVSLTSGNYEQIEEIAPIPPYPEGCYVKFSEEIKKVASIPVGVVGRIRTPDLAEEILFSGKADLVYLGRELIADPKWPQKAAEGGDIRNCIYCNRGCFDRMMNGQSIMCAVNYEVGREKELKIKPALKKRKVLVIGGGPAGMEAARVASIRGHNVTLVERNGRLGGQLKNASIPEHKKDIEALICYLEKQLHDLKVNVLLKKEFSEELLKKEAPEVIIIAVGARPFLPKIPGTDKSNVIFAAEVMEKEITGKEIVVIGGGLVGTEVAELLADKGNNVVIVEAMDDVLLEAGVASKKMMLQRLCGKGVRLLVNAKVLEIQDSCVTIERLGFTEHLPADLVVIATGYKPNTINIDQTVCNAEVHIIGDAFKPRSILESIQEGAGVGWSV